MFDDLTHNNHFVRNIHTSRDSDEPKKAQRSIQKLHRIYPPYDFGHMIAQMSTNSPVHVCVIDSVFRLSLDYLQNALN